MPADHHVGALRLNVEQQDDGVKVRFAAAEELGVALRQGDRPDADRMDRQARPLVDRQVMVDHGPLRRQHDQTILLRRNVLDHRVLLDRLEGQLLPDLGKESVFDSAVEFLRPFQVVDKDLVGGQGRHDVLTLEMPAGHRFPEALDRPALPARRSRRDVGRTAHVLAGHQVRFFRAVGQLGHLQAIIAQIDPDEM